MAAAVNINDAEIFSSKSSQQITNHPEYSHFINVNNGFNIEAYIEHLNEKIVEAKQASRPTTVKKEIIILIYTHGIDIPGEKINQNLTRKVVNPTTHTTSLSHVSIRQCVTGISGTLMTQLGLFKDKMIQAFYEQGIHKINLQERKKIIENTIRLHTAEARLEAVRKLKALNKRSNTNTRRKADNNRKQRDYFHILSQVMSNEDIFPDKLFEKAMNFDVRTIKPQYNHAYYLNGPLPDPTTEGGKNDLLFGVFTVLHSTEQEDQPHTVFGCCESRSKIDISTINKKEVDLYESAYWAKRLRFPGFVNLMVNQVNKNACKTHGFVFNDQKNPVIFLSALTSYLSKIYDNIYFIDISCRDLAHYAKETEKKTRKKMTLKELKKLREEMAEAEISRKSYSRGEEAAQVAE